MTISDPAVSTLDARQVLRLTRGRVPSSFVRQFYAWVADDDLRERGALRIADGISAHFDLARRHAQREIQIRIGNDTVDIVSDDIPFLVDSVTAELNSQGVHLEFLAHPVFRMRRDADGELLDGNPLGRLARAAQRRACDVVSAAKTRERVSLSR